MDLVTAPIEDVQVASNALAKLAVKKLILGVVIGVGVGVAVSIVRSKLASNVEESPAE